MEISPEIEGEKALGQELRAKVLEYTQEGKQIDDDFLKFAGEAMKKIDIDKYCFESEIDRIERKNWAEAETVLNDWKERLNKYEKENRETISRTINEFADFFGEKRPEKIEVDLHFFPGVNRSKGEPASGLSGAGLIDKGDTDVFYWVGKFTESSTPIVDEKNADNRQQISKVVHEVIHENFQKDLFEKILNEANQDEEIVTLRARLMEDQLDYLEPEAELTAIYLEGYINSKLGIVGGSETNELGENIINFRADQKRFGEILRAVIKADDSPKWVKGGPYRALRDGWGMPRNIGEVSPGDSTSENKPISVKSLYKLGEEITDFSLIEKYIQEGRQFDLEFVKELYKIFIEVKNSSK